MSVVYRLPVVVVVVVITCEGCILPEDGMRGGSGEEEEI